VARIDVWCPLPAGAALPCGQLLHCRNASAIFQAGHVLLSIMGDTRRDISLVLPDAATPLDFLVAAYRSEEVPLEMRLEAAKSAALYMHPKLIAIAGMAPRGEVLRLSGGLPLLPGTETQMPQGVVIEGEVIRPEEPDDHA
jgi:hypothetical protein